MERLGQIVLGLGILTSVAVAAVGVRLQATVSSETIAVDQTVDLTISLERDGSQEFDSYRPPVMADFEVVHTSSSRQMQWAGASGQQSVRLIEQHLYTLRPKKRGTLSIGPAVVKVAGQELHTRALSIHVGPSTKTSGAAAAASSYQAPPVPSDLHGNEELFVDARLDKAKVYIGEQVTAAWRLYTQSDILKYRSVEEPKHEDFWCENLFLPVDRLAWDRQAVKGRDYATALLMRKALFPLKAGRLTISPLVAEATTMESAFYAHASAERTSKPLAVEVLPLPSGGRPAHFETVNVGQLELSGTVDRAQVRAGEAVSWQLTLRGRGNVRNFRLPKLEHIDGFKVYEPAVREVVEPGDEVKGAKIYSFLLMPERGGTLTLPSVELPYFDPATAKYAVAKTAPITITVEGDPQKLDGRGAIASSENVLSLQIRPIHNRATVRSHRGESLWRGRWAPAVLVAPPGLWLAVLSADGLRRRLGRETARSKRRRARRTARRRLRVAEHHLKAQRPSAFFGECARIIYEHLEYHLGAKVEALTLAELRLHLEARGFPKEAADAVVGELESCDFARFAPSASGPGEMRAALRRVRGVLTCIEQVKQSETEVAA